jgi:hypothetical protein
VCKLRFWTLFLGTEVLEDTPLHKRPRDDEASIWVYEVCVEEKNTIQHQTAVGNDRRAVFALRVTLIGARFKVLQVQIRISVVIEIHLPRLFQASVMPVTPLQGSHQPR